MDKAFHKQIGRNLKVYVDDLVIKSRTEDEIVRDIEETFKTLREINMKLNHKKCTFGVEEGTFLGYKVNTRGLKQQKRRFDTTNNEAKYEDLIAGLRISEQVSVKNIYANVDSRLVANQVNGTYVEKEADMIRYLEKVRTLTSSFKTFSIRQVPRSENKKADALSKIASTSFAHLSKQVLVEELKEKSISEVEILTLVEEGDTWMDPICEYLMEETLPADLKKARADTRTLIRAYQDYQVHKPAPRNPQQKLTPIASPWPFYKWEIDIVRPFLEGPGKVKFLIVAIKFRDNPFMDWCEKLCIRQYFASVKHSQTNGLVERLNRSLGEGIKASLDARNKNWMEELSHVLWAHRTMIKSSNEDTPFSLTYRTKAVFPAKIDMPTLRTTEVDLVQNNESLEINLNLLEERREKATIREAKSKAKWKSTITLKFEVQVLNRETLCTVTTMQAMQKIQGSYAPNGKDRTKLRKHLERAHTS
nr:reverse transcriptase domain-containing protein [Tanacetum cinerariifolium]